MGFLLLKLLLLCNVFMRAFTNEWGLLPKIFNVLDIAIVGALLLVAAGSPTPPQSEVTVRMRRRLIGFNIVLLLGAVLNFEFFNLLPALGQWLMWNQPLLLFLAVWRLPLPGGAVEEYGTLLKRLIVIQVLIGIAQIPNYYKWGDSEEIIGTF